jgi:GTP-binding protein
VSDEILDYPIFYASAKNGWAISDLNDEKKDMACILDSIIKSIP